MPFLLLSVVLFVIGLAISEKYGPWKDDGDCRGIVWHTIRIPSEQERWAMWWDNYYTQPNQERFRFILPESEILKGTPV